MTYRGFVDWTRDDVNGFWADLFEQAGIGWIPAKQLDIPYGYYATTRCERGTRITSGDGPFYCSADGPGTVFLPLLGIKRLIFPRSTFRARDFAITYVVAHEWGHHVQDLLGLITPGARSIDLELQADCLAGVWAYSVWYRGLLRPGDITEALRLAALIGDARGTSPNAAGAHGTSAQRVGAFLRGYRSGLPSRCAN